MPLSKNVLSITITDPDQPIRIIQISDSHLFESRDNELIGMNTEESFQSVIVLSKKKILTKKYLY
jgi:hypothetical protein